MGLDTCIRHTMFAIRRMDLEQCYLYDLKRSACTDVTVDFVYLKCYGPMGERGKEEASHPFNTAIQVIVIEQYCHTSYPHTTHSCYICPNTPRCYKPSQAHHYSQSWIFSGHVRLIPIVRYKEPLAVKVYHMVWGFGNPYLCFPCNITRVFLHH